MARKFLYAVAVLVVLVLAALLALRIWADELTEIAFVPSEDFVEQEDLAPNAYEDPDMWFSRPGISPLDDPSRWQPALAPPGEMAGDDADETVANQFGPQSPPAASAAPVAAAASVPSATDPATGDQSAERPQFAVFFVHPTSYLDRAHWNAPLGDAESQKRARVFLRGMASAFNQASELWAPRYRQATFGAFLTDSDDAAQALDAAYRDVEQAFDYFLESVDPDTPVVLAGHSQGAMHVLRLLRERVAGSELQRRVAMAYPVGWPVSIEHDLPALGLPACATAEQAGCIVTWSSFAEPADPGPTLRRFEASRGFDGEMRGEGPILCVNPVTGTINGSAPAAENLGTLVPNLELTSGHLTPGAVPARCSERGLMLIGDPPELGAYVLPGNNYHVYDIPLFWKNVQEDVVRRVRAWAAARS